MPAIPRLAILLVLFVCAAPLPRATEIGDAAPPLAIAEWIKGDPVDLEAGKGKNVYVIEFWATWCPPCLKSIPHLTELQQKYRDDGLVIVGISSEEVDTVREFALKKMGDKMDYTVAVDRDRKTGERYMEAFNESGIPHAFLVDREGRLVWHGHPMDGLDRRVEMVLKGDVSLDEMKQAMQKDQERQERSIQVGKLAGVYLFLAGETDEKDLARAVGERILERADGDPQFLNNLAWQILNAEFAEPDTELALRASTRAVEQTDGKESSVLDTHALALFRNGKIDEAIETEKMALALLDENDESRGEVEQRLREFEAAKKE